MPYSDFLADVEAETHLPAEDTAVARHTRAALLHYRFKRFIFSEKSGSFTTVAGQAEYARGSGANLLPADLLEIDVAYYTQSGTTRLLRYAPLAEIRRAQVFVVSGSYPDRYTWHHEKLIFGPAPAGAYLVNLDYRFDCMRNTADGAEFSASSPSGAFDNEMFIRGRELLRTRVIYTMSLGRGLDFELVEANKLLNREAEKSLLHERDLRQLGSGFQVRGCF